MSAAATDAPPRRAPERHRLTGIIAVALSVLASLSGPGLLIVAAVLYGPIARPTTISACEGPSLTPAQDQLSHLVVSLKGWAVLGALVFGIFAMMTAIVAAGLDLGRGFAVAALGILVAAAAASLLLWSFAFRIDPAIWHLPCGAL